MRTDVLRDFTSSTNALHRLVVPTLIQFCPDFGSSAVCIVETSGDVSELHADMDRLAGIDAYQKGQNAMRGIASRVQYDGKAWRTFTVRMSRPSGATTEYEKRLFAIKNADQGFMYPYWTLQAFLSTDRRSLLSVGLCKTRELYLYIEQCEASGARRLPRRNAGTGGEQFIIVAWDAYRLAGNYLFEYPTLRNAHVQAVERKVA